MIIRDQEMDYETRSDSIDFVFDNEIVVLQQIRRLIDFLPASVSYTHLTLPTSDLV